MKIKVPIKTLEKDDIYSKVKETLQEDPENAYTIGGMMVQSFGVKQSDIENKPFSAWKKGQPTLYGRVDRILRRLVKEGKANNRKHERAMVYWYKKPEHKFFELKE